MLRHVTCFTKCKGKFRNFLSAPNRKELLEQESQDEREREAEKKKGKKRKNFHTDLRIYIYIDVKRKFDIVNSNQYKCVRHL